VSTVTIIDYGLGNLHSVINALHHVGAEVAVAEDAVGVRAAERLILPGVGAFADGMKGLTQRGQADAIRTKVASGTPLLGICLGMQLLFDESEEFGLHRGLGVIGGRVARIPNEGVKVPHVGWNRLEPVAAWDASPLAGTASGEWAYFVHSYRALATDPKHLIAESPYGPHRIAAAVAAGSVTGFQFHPEKSGLAGLGMLARFCGLPAPASLTKDAPCAH
jgi:glutamine amidotransferase